MAKSNFTSEKRFEEVAARYVAFLFSQIFPGPNKTKMASLCCQMIGVPPLRIQISVPDAYFHPCGVFHLNSRGSKGVIDVMHWFGMQLVHTIIKPRLLPIVFSNIWLTAAGGGGGDAERRVCQLKLNTSLSSASNQHSLSPTFTNIYICHTRKQQPQTLLIGQVEMLLIIFYFSMETP